MTASRRRCTGTQSVPCRDMFSDDPRRRAVLVRRDMSAASPCAQGSTRPYRATERLSAGPITAGLRGPEPPHTRRRRSTVVRVCGVPTRSKTLRGPALLYCASSSEWEVMRARRSLPSRDITRRTPGYWLLSTAAATRTAKSAAIDEDVMGWRRCVHDVDSRPVDADGFSCASPAPAHRASRF